VLNRCCDGIFENLSQGGVLHVFGAGHSHQIAEEMFHRAGGLVPVNGWLEEYMMPHVGPTQAGGLERLAGVSDVIIKKYKPLTGEYILIASNSGINATSVEVALKCKALGVKTVAITSLEHSKATASRNGGSRLFEVADITIDTGTPVGDACLTFSNLNVKAVPLSGVISLTIGQLIVAGVIERFTNKGMTPPVYKSVNTPGGEDHNKALEKKYSNRLVCLR
jgi:uncharacterized phosphosugar-binding protein